MCFRRLVWVALAATVGCSAKDDALFASPAASIDAGAPPPPQDGGIVIGVDGASRFDPGADCDPARTVRSDGPALLIRDQEILSAFPLERVLAQLLSTAGASALTPEELVQRLFDTMSPRATGVFQDNIHCDDAGNDAFKNAAAVDCPRAEAALASRTTLFTEGDPDSFVPLALVNRFDLMPSSLHTCGEYRLVYGKLSGRSDAASRVLLIFEGVLPNPHHALSGCRPVAELWASLEREPDAAAKRTQLERFFFEGLPGFAPLVHADHFGKDNFSCSYVDCGQVRVALGMQAPWEFREFRLRRAEAGQPGPVLQFVPATVKNSLVPSLFDPWATDDWTLGFRWELQHRSREVVVGERIVDLNVRFSDFYNAGQSALDGPARPDYSSRAVAGETQSPLLAAVSEAIARPEVGCSDGSDLTTEQVLQRLAVLSCAGCHAADRILLPGRELGCGLVWPGTPGAAHIDEHGSVSGALLDVFLPHRANVLSTYLQACDRDAIQRNLQPIPEMTCFVAGTPIAMADGSFKAIEGIAPGELVFAFDEKRAQLVAAEVVRTFVHPNSDQLVVVNSNLVATANHPFYSAGQWIPAGALDIGAPLLTLSTSTGENARPDIVADRVQQLEMRDDVATTYNFEVAVHHNYFAGGVLVHNKPL